MSDEYPQSGLGEFTQSLGKAREALIPYFLDFQNAFKGAPDERGLTDQMLLFMFKRNTKVNFSRLSQVEEGNLGYDYLWKFSCLDPHSPAPTAKKTAIYIQAKSYKHETVDKKDIQVADFTYTQKSGNMQMNLLSATVKAAALADPSARIFGGYIVYGTNDLNFIPLADVLQTYNTYKGLGLAGANRSMSADFLQESKQHKLALEDIATYEPPK